ncbi:class I SAM-dependent methyltransferase [Thioclava sp. GXIMD4216]|uniref:class I SAM-dependent methyltransferase n=1 Tax=Thioclava sp. GXIMD4216 TaxID=3131929 RepID=UPI0030D45138
MSYSHAPYTRPGFYADMLAKGMHRDIVGGRWEETGERQMEIIEEAGVLPHHHLLDIGAGPLRLGCKVVEYLDPGHYWATDASRALMLVGHGRELADPARLDPAQLVEDSGFEFPDIPERITHAIAFGVFPHLPPENLAICLRNLQRLPQLELFMFTVFLRPDEIEAELPYRQRDGVVTHAARAPHDMRAVTVHGMARDTGWSLREDPKKLPRGQILFHARRVG